MLSGGRVVPAAAAGPGRVGAGRLGELRTWKERTEGAEVRTVPSEPGGTPDTALPHLEGRSRPGQPGAQPGAQRGPCRGGPESGPSTARPTHTRPPGGLGGGPRPRPGKAVLRGPLASLTVALVPTPSPPADPLGALGKVLSPSGPQTPSRKARRVTDVCNEVRGERVKGVHTETSTLRLGTGGPATFPVPKEEALRSVCARFGT